MTKLEQIEEILSGIDQVESNTNLGWWPTSVGAEFGSSKLTQIRELFKDDSECGTHNELVMAIDRLTEAFKRSRLS